MIIILNGPINSGKTTLAKILWEKIPNCAHIEVDKIREFIDWMNNKDAWKISMDTAILVAKAFVKNNLNVIITYHISKTTYEKIFNELSPIDPNIFVFTLKPEFENLLTNRGTRELNKWEKGRIKETHEKKSYEVDFGITINNSAQTSQETADIIFNTVKDTIKQHHIYPRR